MAISKTIPVRVIYKSKNEAFAEIIPTDFETEMYVHVTDEEEIIPEKTVHRYNGNKIIGTITYPSYVIEKGTFNGLTFLGKNGEIYASDWIDRIIGPRPISEVFEKINK